MSPWDTIVDELFFGGREKAAAEKATASEAAPAGEAAPEAAPASSPAPKPAPMSLWDSVVDEIFFGGREKAARAAAEAAADEAEPAADEPTTSAAEPAADAAQPEDGEAPAKPAPAPMSLWDSVVDEIFFGGREKAARAAAETAAAKAEPAVDQPTTAIAEPAEATEAVISPEEAAETAQAVTDTAEPAPQAAEAYDFSAAEEKMMALQHKLQEQKIPMVIVLEGWQASGKGTIAGELLEGLDPRGYDVCVRERIPEEAGQYPALYPYWTSMPKQGMITLFIGSWYHDLCAMLVKGKHPKSWENRLEQIRLMEQMLLRDGAVIEKFFLDVPAKVQKKRLKELESRKATRCTLTKADRAQNRHYDRWQQAYRRLLEDTDLPGSRWHLLSGEDKKAAKQALYETLIASMEQAVAQRQAGDRSWDTDALTDHEPIPTEPIPEVELYETDTVLDREYKAAIKAAQKKLHSLQYELYSRGIPLIVAFEGWDAAGKGGAIRRLTSGLDPRGFTVVPIASPTPEEKAHHHLWRFWKNLPKAGDITVFDRTWYGRVMVERLEGFCTEAQWKRSYEEMNLFEKALCDEGAIVCKFWLQISPEEQLKRFERRQNNPEKQWKITEEDWRNREKWPQYEEAVNDMLKKTNTAYAPWTVVEADSKHYARVKVLETVIAAIEKRLG